MKTNRMLLMIGVVGALPLAAAPARGADSRSMIATRLAGTVQIHQDLPGSCGGGSLDVGGPPLGGGIEVTPAGGVDDGAGNKLFTLARLSIRFPSFNPTVQCIAGSTFTDISASLARGVTFTGTPDGRGGYTFTIPSDAFVVYEAAALQDASGGPPQALRSFARTAGPVIGSFEVGRDTWTMRLHVTLNTSIHVSDGDFAGSQTADIQGTLMFPDTDGDGIPDITDTCPFTPNTPNQVIQTPVITPPPAITLTSCADRRFGQATAADICFGRRVGVTNDAPNPFTPGTFLVNWSANDGVDPVVTAQQTVTVVDATPPTFLSTPADITLNDCKASSQVDLGQPRAQDDCGGPVTFTINVPPFFFAGSTNLTWIATDPAGNTSTSQQTVTVVDTTPPTVSCMATGPSVNTFRVSASDQCGTPVIQLGSFVLANGEVVQIQETGQPGVRLIGDPSNNNIRRFLVGRGEAVITATDASHNVATAACIR